MKNKKKRAKKQPSYTPPVITFNEAEHAYTINGFPCLSVTQVLESAGITNIGRVPAEVLEAARKFGNAGHKLLELYDYNDLDESPGGFSEPLRPYLECWKKFKADTGADIKYIEDRVGSERFQFCGTLDRVIYFPKNIQYHNIEIKKGLTLADLKFTSAITPAVKIQVAGYEIALAETRPFLKITQRMVIRLTETEPEVRVYDSPADLEIFKAALIVAHFKIRERIK
jgi:hypothetical protein